MLSLPRQFCIYLWNVAGALHSQNGMHSHSKNPKFPTVKAVYCLEAMSIAICQNPAFKSKQEKYPALILDGFLYLGEWIGVFLGSHI